jgi:ankyrin repeat protein
MRALIAPPMAGAQIEKQPKLDLIIQFYDGTGSPIRNEDKVHLQIDGVHSDDGSKIERTSQGSTQRFDGLPGYGNLSVGDYISGILSNKPLEQIFGSAPPNVGLDLSQVSGRPPGDCIGTDFLPALLSLDTGNSIVKKADHVLTQTAEVMLFPCRNRLQLATWDELENRFPLISAVLARVPDGIDARSNYEKLTREHPNELGNLLNLLYLLSTTSIQSQLGIQYIQAVDWTQPLTASEITLLVSPGTVDTLKAVSHKSPEAAVFKTASPDLSIIVLDRNQNNSRPLLKNPKSFTITWKETPSHEIVLSEPEFSEYVYRDMWHATRFWDKEYSPPFTVVRRTQLTAIEAVDDGDLPQLQLYLEAGGDPDARDPETNYLLLQTASSNQRLDMVQLLLAHGANSESVKSAMTTSCSNGSLEIATLLLPRIDANDLSSTPGPISACLAEAVRNDRVSIFGLLLAHGARSLITGPQGAALMLDAAGLSSPDVAAILLNEGASAKSKTSGGLSPIVVAATASPEITTLLLDHGADPDENLGEPLRTASSRNQPAIVRALLAHGANPNTPLNFAPPLVDAAYSGYPDVVAALLDAKANPNVRNSQGYTALIKACLHAHVEIIKQLIDHGADVNLASTDGATPLLAAAQEGSKESLSFLLEKGANKSVRFNGRTALQIAQMRNNTDAVKLLGGHPKPIDEAKIHGSVENMSVTWPIDRLNHLHALLFQDAFLLKGQDVDSMPLGITDEQISILRQQLQTVLTSLTAMLNQRKGFVANRTGRPVNDNFPIKIDVIDGGLAGAQTTPPATECGPGDSTESQPTQVTCITVDAKLLRADLVASLVQIRPELSRLATERQYESVQEQRRWLRDSIDSTGWDPLLPINPNAGLPQPHFDPWPATGELETQYYGTLLFLIAHEFGHAALGHLLAPPPSCTDRELQADQFAAALVGESFVAQSVVSIGVPFFSEDRLLQYAGWATFFNGTYEYLGLVNSPGQPCQYPDRDLRVQKTMTEFKLIASNDAPNFVAQLRQRQGKSFQALLESWAFGSSFAH